jgi:hypothetical protein
MSPGMDVLLPLSANRPAVSGVKRKVNSVHAVTTIANTRMPSIGSFAHNYDVPHSRGSDTSISCSCPNYRFPNEKVKIFT